MTAAETSPFAGKSDLPAGWELISVGDVSEIKYGKGLKESDRTSGSVPVYGSNGVVGHHNVALTRGPTIIIGRKGSIGAVHFSPSPCWPIDTTYFIDDFLGLNPEFLVHALRVLRLNELDTSTAIPGLNRDDVYSEMFGLPPVTEQNRIGHKVEQLLSRVNAARGRLARLPTILKNFRKAVLSAACTGRLTASWREEQSDGLIPSQVDVAQDTNGEPDFDIPDTWPFSSADAVCDSIVDCPHSTPKWSASGVICLRTTNFRAGSLDLAEVRYVSESTYRERTERLEPRKGDVLYSREGGILGLACLVPPKTRLCLGQRMMLMRPNEQILNPVFLMHVLNSPQINERVRELTGGSASPHLNVAEIKRFPVPVPPAREQAEIVNRVDSLFNLADAIEKHVAAATARAQKLTQAILAKAFRGELVPTEAELARREGRSYEPASALLARIRAERSAQAERDQMRHRNGKRQSRRSAKDHSARSSTPIT